MIADLVLGFVAGLAVGIVFFAGLAWTVDRLSTTRHPALLASLSLVVRMGSLVGALVLVADGRTVRVVAGLVGVLVARTLAVARARRPVDESSWN